MHGRADSVTGHRRKEVICANVINAEKETRKGRKRDFFLASLYVTYFVCDFGQKRKT